MLSEPLSLQWVKPVVLRSSTRFPLRSRHAHNPVQDALVLTKSASSKATSVCPHLPLINSRSGFCRSSHSTAHYHFGYRSRLGVRDRGNLLRYHPGGAGTFDSIFLIGIVAVYQDVAPFDITEVAHPAHEFLAEGIVVRGSRPDVPDTRRLAPLLRPRRKWPRRCRAADCGQQF